MGLKKEKSQRRALSQSPTSACIHSSTRHNPGRIGPRTSPCRSRIDQWRTRTSDDSENNNFSLKSSCPGHCFDNVLPRTVPYRSHADTSRNNVRTAANIKPDRRQRAFSTSSKYQRHNRSRSSSSDASSTRIYKPRKVTTPRDRGDVTKESKRPCILCKPWRHCTLCSPPDRYKPSRSVNKRHDFNKSEIRDKLNKCQSWNPSNLPRTNCADSTCRPWNQCKVCKFLTPSDLIPSRYKSSAQTTSSSYTCPKSRAGCSYNVSNSRPLITRSCYPCSPRPTPRMCNPCPPSSCNPYTPRSCDPYSPRSCKTCPPQSCDPSRPRSCSPCSQRSCSPCSARSCSPCSPQTCSPRKSSCDPCKTSCDPCSNPCNTHVCPWEADVTVSGTVRGHCNNTVADVARRLTGHFHCSGSKLTSATVSSPCDNSCLPDPAKLRLKGLKDGLTLNFSSNKSSTSDALKVDNPNKRILPPSPLSCDLTKMHDIGRIEKHSDKINGHFPQMQKENSRYSSGAEKKSNSRGDAVDQTIDLYRIPSSIKSDASSEHEREKSCYKENVTFKEESFTKENLPTTSDQHRSRHRDSRNNSDGDSRWKYKQSWGTEAPRHACHGHSCDHQCHKEHGKREHRRDSVSYSQDTGDRAASYYRHETDIGYNDNKTKRSSKHRDMPTVEKDSTKREPYLTSQRTFNKHYNKH